MPLAVRDDGFSKNLATLGASVDRQAVLLLWDEALAAPRWDDRPVWLHGDLHPANILVDQGRISGVIDFGDITSGDPATDLAAAWILLPLDHHAAFWAAYGGSPATSLRARGWALALALVFLAHSADNPTLEEVGGRTLERVLASQPRCFDRG